MTCFLHNFRRIRYFPCTAYEGYDSSDRNFLSPARKNKATCEKEEEFSINLGAIEIDTLGDDPK